MRMLSICSHRISIHALLTESDVYSSAPSRYSLTFLSTLSLRRATRFLHVWLAFKTISIHALLTESDDYEQYYIHAPGISIHALLTESDARRESRQQPAGISIHALLTESDQREAKANEDRYKFLSTLSLRRATYQGQAGFAVYRNFYPRSPYGERHQGGTHHEKSRTISIHALLTESDFQTSKLCNLLLTFLSTLSLRRATGAKLHDPGKILFLSTLSLRRATWCWYLGCRPPYHFYPRSPYGERQLTACDGFAHAVFLSTLSLRRATDTTPWVC